MLQIEPWTQDESDTNRHGIPPEIQAHERIGPGHHRLAVTDLWQLNPEKHNRGQGNQTQNAVTELDASNIKFFSKQSGRRQNNQHGQEEIKAGWLQPQRLPSVTDEGKNRQSDGEDLIQKKDQPIRARPVGKKSPQGIGSAASPLGNHLGQSSKNHQTKGVGDGEG